jgi:hypothetical protein
MLAGSDGEGGVGEGPRVATGKAKANELNDVMLMWCVDACLLGVTAKAARPAKVAWVRAAR